MKKKGNISKRTLLYILLTVVILILSISISTSVQIRNVLMDQYTSFALTYVRSAAEFIDGDTVRKYYETGRKDEYYEEISKYLNSTANASSKEASIDYFYIFTPEDEENFTYIWDAEPYEEPMDLLEQYPYSEGAREQAEKLFSKEITEDSQYYIDKENGAYILTVSVPLLDSNNDVVAIVAADLSVSGINLTLTKVILSTLIPVVGIMLLTMVLYYYITKKKIIEPIIILQEATEMIVENIDSDKPVDIDINTNDEIEMLADSFTEMNGKLRDYIKQNEAITAEKERIGAELELATKIQADMLPNIFPAFPERDDFDVYASMVPAKEVGGDFYDFFLIDDTKLAVVIADVSGKGVPAALFMMMSKILIQNQAMSGKSPAEVLEAVNNQICSNNREEMFVTVWLGMLDLQTGLLTAANAGHEKPFIQMPGGEFELYSDKHGFVIGGMEGIKYKNYQIQLEKGSKIFVYTDGVAEATNSGDELFGIERTLRALNTVTDGNPDDILKAVKLSVDEFVGEAPQFDDITMLCLEFVGSDDAVREITFENEISEIAKVTDFISEQTENLTFSFKDRNQIEVAVDEIASNIVHYAYGEGKGSAKVRVDVDSSGMTIVFEDSGTPYNPLEKEDPDVTLSADERGIGGYGIFIVKKVMDEVSYEYKSGKNILTMRKNFTE